MPTPAEISDATRLAGDRAMVARYLDQPSELPPEVRERVGLAFGGGEGKRGTILLYGMAAARLPQAVAQTREDAEPSSGGGGSMSAFELRTSPAGRFEFRPDGAEEFQDAKDVAEDLYLIADVEALDDRSRKILWAFSD